MNNLEVLLAEAFSDSTLRVQFYTLLMNSEVFVVYIEADSDIIDGKLKKGQKVTLATLKRKDGTNVIPFFTSEEAMRKVVQGEVKYIKMNCSELFGMIKGGEAVLNPFLENTKEFSAGEITALVEGYEMSEQPINMEQTEESEIRETREMISQHEKMPEKLIDQIKRYFAGEKRVKKSYIAVYDNPVLERDLKTLIIVDCSGGYEEIKQEIIKCAQESNDSGYNVEVLKHAEGNNLCEIVENRYSPFYMKKFLGIF